MNNTDGFKHFKLYSDSTLRVLSKKELIIYIHVLYHNWQVTDELCFNVLEHDKELQDDFQNIKPYKFEDLKPNMWVWDNKYQICNKILEIRINCANEQEIEFEYSIETENEFYNDIFEENRFFPVQKANEVLENG